MSRKLLGWLLVIIAAISMAINMFFLQSNEQYDLVRRVTYGLFVMGVLLIPTYIKTET